jgi:hypothetical protein
MTEVYSSHVIRHYQRAWGEPAYEARWARGPAADLPSAFRVLVFDPTQDRSLWVYATCGMSDTPGASAIELHLFSPREYSGHIELLTAVAHYHWSGHPLDVVGSTVNFGREWMPGSQLTHGLISLPYRDGPTLETVGDQDGNLLLRCYWLLPITQSEREYKKRFGLEKLEALFDQHGLQYADPQRASVAQ